MRIDDVLQKLYRLDMTNLLVEGGPAILSSFFRANLIDEAWVFTAPQIIGDDNALTINFGRKTSSILDALHPHRVHTRQSGTDTFHRMWFKHTKSS